MKKTGNFLARFALSLSFLCMSTSAHAEIRANVDRSEVPQDESISLKITETGQKELSPKFEAPDFEIMNQFESSQFSSVYTNGHFENKSERSVTYILRPLKVGNLRIRNINNNGEKAPDLTVQVKQENNYKKSAGSEAPSLNGDAKNFFVKADVSKSRAFRGEQVVVSYYLYRRTRVNLRDVMQYPSFEGFIREDLEMPILSGRPDFEAVNLGGVPFERALLARYAVYPIKEGKLKIDGFSIRADYIPRNPGNDDAFEDPFFQFFSQVNPRTGTSKSDPVIIESLPLPEEGKPAQFTGGVGEFEVNAILEAATQRTNSPLTLKVTVRGKGNASLIEFPQVDWPKSLKFYESQGKSRAMGQGVTEKTFDVVLVPLEVGEYEIPPIDFVFFNPESRSYVHKKTNPIPLRVTQGDASSAPVVIDKTGDESSATPSASADPAITKFGDLRKDNSKMEGTGTFLGQPWWRWVVWFGLLVFFWFIGLVIFDTAKKRSLAKLDLLKRKQTTDSLWSRLSKEAQELSQSHAKTDQFSPILEEAVDQIYLTLDETFGLTSRAHALRELGQLLTQNHSLTTEEWKHVAEILEYSEMIRFASSSGVVPDSAAQEKVPQLIEEAKRLCGEIPNRKRV